MKCDRCGEETWVHMMSMYNTQELCINCKEKEKKRPDYKEAVEADEAAIRQGNYNFKGIGLR